MTVSKAVIEYMDYISVTKAKGTHAFYKQYLSVISDILGDYDCDEITNTIIVSFIKSQKERNPEIANSTLNKFVGAIKSLISYTCNKSLKFSKLKEQKKIIPTISASTINKIFNYYQKNMGDKNVFRNYVFLKLLLDTGLRMNEIINIKLKNIDFGTNSIHVQITKTDVDRYVCFTESTSQLLRKFIVVHNIDDYIFFDFDTKNIMTTSSVESFIYRLKIKLNITENITPHKWRHTFATTFIKNSGDLETLRLLLGHSNLKTTQKYLHLSRNDIVDNYQKIMN
ncbi:MAG: site-specific integrase [Firmicutes bacterium]|nr:site-specific integrase [Bacillota bacterium]